MRKSLPSPLLLRKLLRYEPETGVLTWLERPVEMFDGGTHNSPKRSQAVWNARYAGKEAFTAISCGYKRGSISPHNLLAHRVILTMVHGHWPNGQIDHVNHIRTDNRIENLREVSNAENARNATLSKLNTSGQCGVSWVPERLRWQVYISVKGRRVPLGRYRSWEKAVAVRKEAEQKSGYHANHGRVA